MLLAKQRLVEAYVTLAGCLFQVVFFSRIDEDPYPKINLHYLSFLFGHIVPVLFIKIDRI